MSEFDGSAKRDSSKYLLAVVGLCLLQSIFFKFWSWHTLRTVKENIIVVEQLADGSRSVAVNPRNLEDRNSLAKQ